MDTIQLSRSSKIKISARPVRVQVNTHDFVPSYLDFNRIPKMLSKMKNCELTRKTMGTKIERVKNLLRWPC